MTDRDRTFRRSKASEETDSIGFPNLTALKESEVTGSVTPHRDSFGNILLVSGSNLEDETYIGAALFRRNFDLEDLKLALDIEIDELIPTDVGPEPDVVPRSRLLEAQELVSQLQDRVNTLSDDLSDTEANLNTARSNAEAQRNRANSLDAQVDSLQEQINTLLEENRQCNQERAELKAENEILKARAESAENLFCDIQAFMEAMQDEYGDSLTTEDRQRFVELFRLNEGDDVLLIRGPYTGVTGTVLKNTPFQFEIQLRREGEIAPTSTTWSYTYLAVPGGTGSDISEDTPIVESREDEKRELETGDRVRIVSGQYSGRLGTIFGNDQENRRVGVKVDGLSLITRFRQYTYDEIEVV